MKALGLENDFYAFAFCNGAQLTLTLQKEHLFSSVKSREIENRNKVAVMLSPCRSVLLLRITFHSQVWAAACSFGPAASSVCRWAWKYALEIWHTCLLFSIILYNLSDLWHFWTSWAEIALQVFWSVLSVFAPFVTVLNNLSSNYSSFQIILHNLVLNMHQYVLF